jgi:hypothetical protein
VLGLFAAGLLFYGVLLRWPPRFLRRLVAQANASSADSGANAAADTLPNRLWRRFWQIAGKLWAPLQQAGLRGHLRALLVRLPHLAVLLLWNIVALRCFRIEVPVHIAMLYLPVVFAVAALPISVQGLGTAQVVARYYFSDFAAGSGGDEAVLAWSLSMTAISTASNLIMGVLFLRRGARLGLGDTTANTLATTPNATDSGAVLYTNSEDQLILH